MVRGPHQRLTASERESILQTIRQTGTLQSAYDLPTMTRWAIRTERDVDPDFNRLIIEAIDAGKQAIGDEALENIRQCASGHVAMSKSQLTANLALANAYAPGFKGVRHSESKIQHDIRVITSVPRPQYQVPAPEQVIIDVVAREIEDDEKTDKSETAAPAKKTARNTK